MEGSKPKEKVPPQEMVKTKEDQDNQGKPMKEKEYWPGLSCLTQVGGNE